MKNTAIVGVLLVLLGVIGVVYQGLPDTSHEPMLDIGPLHATAERQKTSPPSPVLSGAPVAGGMPLVGLRTSA